MATAVGTKVEIVLEDDTKVTLKPLVVSRLRRFMDAWKKFSDAKTEEDTFDVFVAVSGIALEKQLNKKVPNQYDDDSKEMTDEYKEYLEDSLDMDTIYKVLEVCGGMKLNDPNLLALATQAAERDGKN